MTEQLATLLALGTGTSAVVLLFALFSFKSARWWTHRRYAIRRATYVSAIGEIIARDLGASDLSGWPDDPAFVDVVTEYADIVAGDERQRLEQIIRRAAIRDRLVSDLGSRRRRRRLRATARLSILADHTTAAALIRALDDPSPEVRIQAARGLAVSRTASAISRLVHMVLVEEPWVAARIADQVVAFGTDAVPILLEVIDDGFDGATVDHGTVEIVARILGLIGDLRASGPLARLLSHPSAETRIAAASALGRSGTLDVVVHLVGALGDDDWRVRARAAASLATFSDPSSVEPLARCLDDTSWWVRRNAAASLLEVPGGTHRLADALVVGSHDARQVAEMQLVSSGTVATARRRHVTGEATAADRRLVGLVDGLERGFAS